MASAMADPYLLGQIYSAALMAFCVECWWRADPFLLNRSPLFLFNKPPIPQVPYTNVFSAWHAGGVCFCFFMHMIAGDFDTPQKAKVSLALGLLWVIWGSNNTYRAIFGENEFWRPGIALHSLVGGCGICGIWHLWFWYSNNEEVRFGERVVLGTFAVLVVCTIISFATGGVQMWKPAAARELSKPLL